MKTSQHIALKLAYMYATARQWQDLHIKDKNLMTALIELLPDDEKAVAKHIQAHLIPYELTDVSRIAATKPLKQQLYILYTALYGSRKVPLSTADTATRGNFRLYQDQRAELIDEVLTELTNT